jgi:hypothetical protein
MAARSSTRWLGVVSTLGLGTACTDHCEGLAFEPPPAPDPDVSETPQVLEGEWIGPNVLELRFSKGLSSNGDLDPRRFGIFAWDADHLSASGQCYLGTSYRALIAGYYYYVPPFGITDVWIGPEDDTLLRVRLSSSTAQCRSSSFTVATGLLLAFTDEDDLSLGAGLLDEDGVPVPDLGPAWAIQELDGCIGSSYCGYVSESAYGHLPELDSLAPIPCP